MVVNGKFHAIVSSGLPQPHSVEGIQGCCRHVIGLYTGRMTYGEEEKKESYVRVKRQLVR